MLKLTVSGNWVEESPAPPAWLGAWKAVAIFLGGLYTWLMIAGLIGLFQRHFAECTGRWKYLAGASYWCYLAGFPVQAAFQVWFAPVGYPIVAEFLLVNALTFGVLLITYELCVRRTWVGVMLNGKPSVERVVPVVVAARIAVPEPRIAVRPATLPKPKSAAVPNRTGIRVSPSGTDSSSVPARRS
jgi:glucan biosynthesis protein C